MGNNMDINLKKASIVSISLGVIGLVILGILSAVGIATFLTGLLGANAVATAALIFGTLVVLGIAGYVTDLILGWLHWR